CASLIISLLSNGDSTSRILRTQARSKRFRKKTPCHWIAIWISIPKRH
ncbi:unnamed protein product, partial [Brassica napus]